MPSSGSVRAGRLLLAYESTPGAPGRDVLLLHGGAHNLRVWDGMLSELARLGSVTALDLRGHGLSDGGADQGVSAHAADVAHVVDELALGQPLLVGHSFGATVALRYASSGGATEGVVLLDALVADMGATYGLTRHDVLRSLQARPRFVGSREDAEAHVHEVLADEPPEQHAAWLAVARRSLVEEGGLVVERPRHDEVVGLVDAQFGWQPYEHFRRLSVPALVMLASNGAQPPDGADESVRDLAVAQLTSIDAPVTVVRIESDHNIPVSRPDAAARAVREWVASL